MSRVPSIKGQVVFNIRTYLRDRCDAAARERYVAALDPEHRALLERPTLVPSSWIPESDWTALVEALAVIGPGGAESCQRAWGRYGAGQDFGGMYKPFVALASTTMVLTAIVKLWGVYRNVGVARVVEKGPGRFVYDVESPECAPGSVNTIMGYLEVAAELSGARNVHATWEQPSPGRYRATCVWE